MLSRFFKGARYKRINIYNVSASQFKHHQVFRFHPKTINIGAFGYLAPYTAFSSNNRNSPLDDVDSAIAKLIKKDLREKKMRGRIGGGHSSSGYSSGP